ncbi:MAG TPA: hypothetical protein VIH89_14890 [Candidatus Sulfotelmatobacter sp.]
MARRPNRGNAEALSEEDLKEVRHNPAHVKAFAIRDFHERSYGARRRLYDHMPTLKQTQMLVQTWKQLWKCC